MKKRLIALMLLAASGFALEARHGGGHGGHRGGRGGYHHGGHRHGGWGRGWGRGWGFGPAVGFGVTVPVGGSSYVAPAAPYQAGDPFYRYERLFGSSPNKNKKAYRRWLFDNYPSDQAQYWWNYFINNHYNPYVASKPQAAVSFGIGGGYGYGPGWRRRGWWW